MDKQAIIKALRDTAQSASNSVAETASAPIDAITWALRKAGLPVPENAVGSSDWMAQKGLTAPVEAGIPKMAGEVLGNVVPAIGFAKAPQIARGMNRMVDNAMAPATMNKQRGAIVWHGSPHKFDKFDSSKIGTGEGAQVYGHGLYFAESPDVAKSYAKKLTDAQNLVGASGKTYATTYNGSSQAMDEAVHLINAGMYKSVDDAIKSTSEILSSFKPGDPRIAALSNRLLAYKTMADDALKIPEQQFYKVDLPDEHIAKMLDWDNAVPEAQRAPISQAALKQFGSVLTGTSGEHLYKEVVKEFERAGHAAPKDAATAWLREQGIPGIRYLDGGSRSAGQGTSNFVVFPGNEDILNILERNGKSK